MNTAQECLELLLPDYTTRVGLFPLTSPRPYTHKTAVTVLITEQTFGRTLSLVETIDRSGDVPRAIRLRNPEAYGPQVQVSWGVNIHGDGTHQVCSYKHINLGIEWVLGEGNQGDLPDAMEKLTGYLRNLIKLDYAWEG